MDQDKVLIETMGYIKKESTLSTVENNIVPNTFVLESLHPYPGYHGANLPEKSKPRSLFLVVSKDYSFEEVARVTKKIKENFQHDFNASIGKIYFKTISYDCIRIKYLESYAYLPELQTLLQVEGIKFVKQKQINSRGLIVIRKHFNVEELQEGIYNDLDEHSKFYVELPVDLGWEDFKEVTVNIKNNVDNSNFDAAQGVFYRKNGIVEVVRLYICEGESDKLGVIQKMYLENIKKKF